MEVKEFKISGEERLLRAIFGERVGKTVEILQTEEKESKKTKETVLRY